MKKILLATDDSTYANDAAWFLARLPHADKVAITVVSVLYVPGSGRSSVAGDWVDTVLQQERERAVETYAKIEAMFEGANVDLQHVIQEGHVGEQIVAVAKEQQADFVVIGARGHSAVARLLLGSTSDYVATHAPCSVLIVRPTGLREATHPIRIVIAYDDSDPAEAALREIAQVHWGSEPDLRVVSVSLLGGLDESKQSDAADQAASRAAERLRQTAAHVTSESIQHDHIGEGLVRYLEQNACDIVVLGETPRTRLGRVLMGSTSRFLLRHAPCSVWIAPIASTRLRFSHDHDAAVAVAEHMT